MGKFYPPSARNSRIWATGTNWPPFGLTTNIYDRKIARETPKVMSPFNKLDRTMHDLLIRGATVVDGTGAEPLTADVAVNNSLITKVGRITSNAHRTITADGVHFLTSFVDIHTHYDGQVSWDETFPPSIYHGVTTLVMGNCGVGFAPVMKADLNLVQLDRFALPLPRIVRDLPSGGRRLMQKASGYLATFVSGQAVTEDGEITAARPGRWTRGPGATTAR